MNVRNDGAVNSGENTASSVISDAGTGSTAAGSISGNRLLFPGRFSAER